MYERLTSTHLVGRAEELSELERALEQSAARRPALVLVGGDSGIGKTRLLNEFERALADRSDDPLVLRGEAVHTGDGELPYGPLLGAVRSLVRTRDPVFAELPAGSRAQLSALLPGLDDSPPAPAREDPAAQVRLFEALLELLDRLGDRRPVLLVLEDIHWADRSTRAFIAYLARSLTRERLLVLLSYRTDELHRRHPFRPLLAELERTPRVHRLLLDPLSRDELSAVLGDILGVPPTPNLVERLHVRAEGNPLFTEELLAADRDASAVAPQSLRDAFMLRIERLSVDAQRAARVIAVGGALTEPVIGELSGLEHVELHEALREAVAAHVLVPRGEDCLSFRHELLREAMYEDLLPGERSELHVALAQVLERQAAAADGCDVELASSIAHHYSAAGDQPAALRASVSAARAARAVHAAGEAARMAERALELWPRVANAEELAGMSRLDLELLVGGALLDAGPVPRAEQFLRAALERLDLEAQPSACAAVLFLLARTQWQLNRGLEGVRTARRALALLPEGDGDPQRTALLGWLARTEFLRGHFRDAARDGQAAMAAALEAGDRIVEAHVLNTLGMAEVMLGDVDSGTQRLRRAIAIAEEEGNLDSASTAYSNLAEMLSLAGRAEEGLAVARHGLIAVPRHSRSSYVCMILTVSELAFATGDWLTARSHLGPPPSELAGTRRLVRLLREAELALGVGDEEPAARTLEEAAPLVGGSSEPQYIGAFGALAGELHRRRRDLTAARRAIRGALDRIEVCSDDVIRIARVTAAGLRVEADIAQRARDLREREEERDAITRARLHLQTLRAAASEGGPVEAAWRSNGEADLARARGRGDPRLWMEAARRWEDLKRSYEMALARWHAAEAAAGAGDRALATEQATVALETAMQLGSRWLTAQLRSLAQRARLQLGSEAPLEEAHADEAPFGLTPREREVLSLIAEGATNRQIGAALFMAEKTASVHVSRILAKLGVHSRTEAAALAHRLGLATGARDLAAARPR